MGKDGRRKEEEKKDRPGWELNPFSHSDLLKTTTNKNKATTETGAELARLLSG